MPPRPPTLAQKGAQPASVQPGANRTVPGAVKAASGSCYQSSAFKHGLS